MTTQANDDRGKPDTPPGLLRVTVYNEDTGGAPIIVSAGPGEKVEKVIAQAYVELNKQPSDRDRLICVASGESVKPFAEMHLREYAAGQCSDLVWSYAGDTGGA
jgi:hypothetical protein